MKCTTIECSSTAVTRCPDTGRVHCLKCSIKIAERFGADSVESLEGMELPWEDGDLKVCGYCGNKYSLYLIGHTGDCPKCRKPLPEEVIKCQKEG